MVVGAGHGIDHDVYPLLSSRDGKCLEWLHHPPTSHFLWLLEVALPIHMHFLQLSTIVSALKHIDGGILDYVFSSPHSHMIETRFVSVLSVWCGCCSGVCIGHFKGEGHIRIEQLVLVLCSRCVDFLRVVSRARRECGSEQQYCGGSEKQLFHEKTFYFLAHGRLVMLIMLWMIGCLPFCWGKTGIAEGLSYSSASPESG